MKANPGFIDTSGFMTRPHKDNFRERFSYEYIYNITNKAMLNPRKSTMSVVGNPSIVLNKRTEGLDEL